MLGGIFESTFMDFLNVLFSLRIWFYKRVTWSQRTSLTGPVECLFRERFKSMIRSEGLISQFAPNRRIGYFSIRITKNVLF
ncbi:hypothetical protein DLM75_11945 [Leptospira stimsonii]|uniref:Uncharacterized protein n=1 Tax=Leptospira stimsonii TaxID=2202203 RepID=A0A396Z7J3_9LEPT|nr:hypothetical protein DLM75_11945 [Leptospira stimsonii]